jgi:hypothetical protein
MVRRKSVHHTCIILGEIKEGVYEEYRVRRKFRLPPTTYYRMVATHRTTRRTVVVTERSYRHENIITNDGTAQKIKNQQQSPTVFQRFKKFFLTTTTEHNAMNKSSVLHSLATLLLVVVTLLDATQRALGLIQENFLNHQGKSKSRSSLAVQLASKVDIWNNVIDVEQLAPLLHEESSRIGLGHKVFSRSPTSNAETTSSSSIIEQTLDSILTELNDDSKYVEYWTRLEWRSIQAHADIDEYKAKEEQQLGTIHETGFRYPRNGHVLYLQVGRNVRGPTCVFPDRRSGGDLLRSIEREGFCSGDHDSCNGAEVHTNGQVDVQNELECNDEVSVNDPEDGNVELVTVPAVPGRLLRFQGDCLHAVPRPTDLWLLKFVKGSPVFEPQEDWGRSVILFNTWNDEPPSGLPVDEKDDDDGATASNSTLEVPYRCNKMDEWSRTNPLSSTSLSAPPYDESSAESPEDEHHYQDEQPQQPLSTKIWLLGDYRRRDHQMQTVKLEASESLREALYQESNVMSTQLKIPS